MALIQRKLNPPSLTNTISRSVTLSNATIDNNAGLTVLSAPAGYGKSCFIEQWLKTTGRGFSWFNIDKYDDSPRSFWSYLSECLSKVAPDIKKSVQGLLSQTSEPDYTEYVDWLLTTLEQTGRKWDRPDRFTLVIDNFDFIKNPLITHSLCRFLDYTPHWLNIIILSRSSLNIDLPERLSKGQTEVINKTTLAFSGDEIREYCELLLDKCLSNSDINKIRQKTDGWPSLVHILCLSLRSGLSLDDALSSSEENLSGFLLQQIFNRLPPKQQPLCKALAIATKFDKPLAEDLFKEEGAEAFQRFTHHDYIAAPSTNETGYFQFTPLFREWLCDEEIDRDESKPLLTKIIDYFLSKEDIDEALELALQYKLWGKAMDILHCSSPNYLQLYLSGSVEKILNRFPEEEINRYPYLLMLKALREFSLFHYQSAQKTLTLLRKTISDLPSADEGFIVPEQTRNLIELGTIFIDAHMLRFSGQTAIAIAKTQKLLSSIETSPSQLTCWCYCGLTIDHFMNDNMIQAIDNGFTALSLAKQSDDAPCAMASLGWLLPSLLLAGKVAIAEQVAEENCLWLQERGYDRLPDMLFVKAQRVSLHRERFDLIKANQLYSDIEKCLTVKTDPRNIIYAKYCVSFELLLTSNKITEAKSLLPKLEADIRGNYHAEDFIGFFDVGAMNAIADLKQGNSATLLSWNAARKRDQEKTPHQQNNLDLLSCLAEFVMQKDCSEKLAATKQQSLANGNVWRAVKTDILLSMLRMTQGRLDEAQKVFQEALSTGQSAGYFATFAEDIKLLTPLISIAQSQPALSNYCHQLLAITKPPENKQTTNKQDASQPADKNNNPDTLKLIEALTPRELEVLQMVNEGLSNKAICEKLGLSLSTIKNHLGNTFNKLNVKRRTEAVSVARAARLL